MALHLFGGEYDMEDLEDPDDVRIIREQGDDDRPVDVVDYYNGRTPDTNALMDELAHDLSVRELKALERRIRKDRIFAELAASYHQTLSVLPLPSSLPVVIAPALVLVPPVLVHAASVNAATSMTAAAAMCLLRINYLLVIEVVAARGELTPLRADLVAT